MRAFSLILSQPASPVCTPPAACPADFDGNGYVRPADVAVFVLSWLSGLSEHTLAGDFDGNGLVEPADISVFVGVWFAAASSGC